MNTNRLTLQIAKLVPPSALACALQLAYLSLGGIDACHGADFLSRPGFPGAIISEDGTRVGWYIQENGEWQVTDTQGNEVWRLMPTTAGQLALDRSGKRASKGNELWYDSGEWQELQGSAFDISADGQTVVGRIFGESGDHDDREAFLWTAVDGMTLLPPISDYRGSEAKAVSADGRVTAGQSLRTEDQNNLSTTEWEATIWTNNGAGGFDALGLGRPGGENTDARLISSDGSVVAGVARLEAPFDRAFRWTKEEGIVKLDLLAGSTQYTPRGMTSDGSIIVGSANWVGSGGFGRPFVWDEVHGTRDLEDVLVEEHGFSPDVFPAEIETGVRVESISGDGTVLGGFYRVDDEDVGWLAVLDRPLVITSGVLGDFDGNAILDVADLDLLSLELQNDRSVVLFDVDENGAVDFSDRRYWVEELLGTYLGDADLDRDVDFADFLSLSGGFGKPGGWADGDFSGDGNVLFEDFLMLSEHFGKSATPLGELASVPEPTSVLLLALGALLTLGYRRRYTR